MIGASDEEQPNQQEEPSGSADGDEEKVTPMNEQFQTEMNEHDSGPRGAAQAAVYQARAGGPAIERVAKSMESTAGYLHEHEAAAIAGDVSSYVKLHPTAAMVLAALVGFLLGRLLK